jgi:hypothetical protein
MVTWHHIKVEKYKFWVERYKNADAAIFTSIVSQVVENGKIEVASST